MNSIKQTDLFTFFQDFQFFVDSSKPTIIQLLEEFLDLSSFIPSEFFGAYYSHNGRSRDYSLYSMLSSLILQKLLSIPSTSLLITFLEISSELRDYCGFSTVPHKPVFKISI